VAYALDLSTEILTKQKPQPDELVSLKIAKGVLWQRRKFVDSREYEIKNKADKDRTLVLEQAYTEDWKLIEPKEPYERAQNLLRFKVAVPAQKTVSQNVVLERVADQQIALTNVGLDDIRIYLRAQVISPKVKEALEKVIALRTELDEVARQRGRLEKQQEEAVAEQARIRENLKTLDKSTDAYQRQLKSFDEVDARIVASRQEISNKRDQEEQKRKGWRVTSVVDVELSNPSPLLGRRRVLMAPSSADVYHHVACDAAMRCPTHRCPATCPTPAGR
jgi:hypothetical protein